MTETERNQIKGALLKCAEENENRPTFTGNIVVSSLCKSAVERIEELEKENAQLKSKNCWKTCEYAEPKSQWISQHIQDVVQLTKAKEIIKDYITIVKGAHTTVCGVSEENRTIYVLQLNEKAEEFLNSEVEQ